MIIKIGLENNFEGRSLAWALELPGCFNYGASSAAALAGLPKAIVGYQAWLNSHTPDSWLADLGDFDIRLEETFDCYTIDDEFELAAQGYEVNAFFRHDWKPLQKADIQRGLLQLEWSRADLMELVNAIPRARFDVVQPGERWSIRGILGHIAEAEFWYLTRLDLTAASRKDLPADAIEKLYTVRSLLNAALPALVDSGQVCGKEGELWSPRKLLRRALWHELDHTNHILKLLAMK